MPRRFGQGRHVSLLLALSAFYALYPLAVEFGRVRFFRIAFILILVLAVYSLGGSRWHFRVAATLGLPAALTQLAVLAAPSGVTHIAGLCLALVFLGFAAVVVLASVLQAGPVTGDRIAGAICVYLLIGLVWALLYGLIASLDPTAFRLPDGFPDSVAGREYAFIYYSFVTLTTLGYGDITPTNHWSQALAWMEAVVGQVFLAILVARLVGLHIAHAASASE